MKYIKKIFLTLLSICLAFLVLFSCITKNEKKQRKPIEENANLPGKTTDIINYDTTLDCDTSLWKYVYNPERLQIITKCKTVTGTIEESNADEDGDQHMLLKLDKGQKDLLTKRNMKKKQGDLVIEAVCANKPILKKVGTTCNGYINKIQIPKVGEHVKVTGSLVIDGHNGWSEIHPIMKIEILK